jgi:PAS domain S-box-containing protein
MSERTEELFEKAPGNGETDGRPLNQTFYRLIKNSPFGVYIIDSEFRLREVSAGAQKVFENVRPLIGRDFADVLRHIWEEPFASEAIARFRQTLKTGEPYEARDTTEQRQDVPAVESYDWRIERIELPDGTHGVVCNFYDLSEIRRAQEELRNRSEQFQTLLQHAPIGVLLVDADFRFSKINPVGLPAFEEIDDLIGRDFEEVMFRLWPRERAGEIVRIFRHTLETGEGHHMPEMAELRRDRAVTEYYTWDVHRITLPNGQYGVVCYFTDISAQVNAREAIAESRERYRRLFESMDEGFCVVRVLFNAKGEPEDMRFLEVNPAFDRQTGLSSAAGQTLRTLVPGIEQLWLEVFGDVALRGEPRRFVNRAAVMERWFDLYAFRVGEPGEHRVAILFTDITERKLAEEALQESEARFRAVADLVPDLLWQADRTGARTWVNRRWLEYTGLKHESSIGYGWAHALHPSERDEVLRDYRDAIESGRHYRHEHRTRDANGRYRWFRAEALPVRDASGAITQWFGSSTDIHEERSALDHLEALVEERTRSLAESEEHRRIALEAADLGTWVLDLTTDTSPVRSFRHDQIFGYSEPQAEWGKEIALRHILPEDRDTFRNAFLEAAQTGEMSCEVRVRWPDGSVRWIAPRGRTTYDDEGRPVRMAGVVADITESRLAREQLRDMALRLTMAEQAERRRISQVLHDDLQQLLYAIKMKAKVARHGLHDGEKPAQSLDEVATWLDHAIRMTRHLTVDLSPPVLKSEGLVEALGWLQTQVRELYGLEVTLEADGPLSIPDEDLRVLLFQIIRELLFNIRKHAGTDRALISLTEEDDMLSIRVIDEGRGMDPGLLDARDSGEGGFGLFNARERIRLMGGEVAVISSDAGTTVVITVPGAAR